MRRGCYPARSQLGCNQQKSSHGQGHNKSKILESNNSSLNDYSSRVGRPPRAMGTLKNRWTKLRGACVKFSGFYATAKRTQPSGTLDIELEDAAHALFLAGK